MKQMKLKLHYLDLTICAIWLLFAYGTYGGGITLPFVIMMLAVFYRFVLLFSLSKKEMRSWLPLLIFLPFAAWIVFSNHYCLEQIADYFFHLTHLEYSDVIHHTIVYFFLLSNLNDNAAFIHFRTFYERPWLPAHVFQRCPLNILVNMPLS